MPSDSNPVYLTAGRYAIWVASSLISTALALVNGYYFHNTSKTYWAAFIPLQVCAIVPGILYATCSMPRPTSFWKGFLKLLHYTVWQVGIQETQCYLVPWLAKHWHMEMATWASVDLLFVFFLGLDIAMLADYGATSLLIQPIQIQWERAQEYLVPRGLNGSSRQRGAVDRKQVKRWFFIRLLTFYNRIVIIIGLTMSWLPILLFAPMDPEAWKLAFRNIDWLVIGYSGVLVAAVYPAVLALPLLVWKCQVGEDCRRKDEAEDVGLGNV